MYIFEWLLFTFFSRILNHRMLIDRMPDANHEWSRRRHFSSLYFKYPWASSFASHSNCFPATFHHFSIFLFFIVISIYFSLLLMIKWFFCSSKQFLKNLKKKISFDCRRRQIAEIMQNYYENKHIIRNGAFIFCFFFCCRSIGMETFIWFPNVTHIK